jgi:F0F1-type ATP synthase assembly protein I
MESGQKKNSSRQQALRYTSLGMQMLVYLALGVYGGLKFDEWFNTNPLFVILLSALALFFSLLHLYRQLVGKS